MERCQYCGADLLGEPLPEHLLNDDVGTHYVNVNVLISKEHNIILECPYCEEWWPKNV